MQYTRTAAEKESIGHGSGQRSNGSKSPNNKQQTRQRDVDNLTSEQPLRNCETAGSKCFYLEIGLAENGVDRNQLLLRQGVLLQQHGRAGRKPVALPQAVLGHVELLRPLLVRLSVYKEEALAFLFHPGRGERKAYMDVGNVGEGRYFVAARSGADEVARILRLPLFLEAA